VISITCLYFSTIEGLLLLQATLALGYTRFAAGFHYPSDLIAGMALGITCGLPIFLL
jgi:membrane-associated phospholipid phosphatase